MASRAPALTTTPPAEFRRTFKAIEDLRVGDRVLADNPDEASPDQTVIDPATWRLLTLFAEDRWPDGTHDTIHIQTLQPPAWVELFAAGVGAEVPPPLDLVEMGLSEDLITTVVKNEPCPSLQPPLAGEDPGRLILTTVNHLNPDVWELTAEPIRGPPGAAASPRTLRPTGAHKFYSESRGGWAATNELEPGEVIRGRSGSMRVTRTGPLPGMDRVYNLTVEGEHVYYVSELGLLAHNNCPVREYDVGTLAELTARSPPGDKLASHELLQSAFLQRHLGATRRSSIGRRNPAIVISDELHDKVIHGLQAEAGLHSRLLIDRQTAISNALENARILVEAGVPRDRVADLLAQTRKFIREVGL